MSRTQSQITPQARTEGLVIKNLPDEVLIYDLDRHKAYCLNETAALIWKNCDGRTTIQEMGKLLKQMDTNAGEDVVWFALDRLEKARLLNEKVSQLANVPKPSRRELLGKLGASALLAVPVILSVTSPTAAQTASMGTVTSTQCMAGGPAIGLCCVQMNGTRKICENNNGMGQCNGNNC